MKPQIILIKGKHPIRFSGSHYSVPKVQSAAAVNDNIRRRIEALESLWKSTTSSRQKTAQYKYLAEVYGLYRDLREKEMARKTTKRIAQWKNVKNYERMHSIRRIIAATSDANNKAASRMTLALRYASLKKWSDIKHGFKSNGGIAGCAKKFSEYKRAK